MQIPSIAILAIGDKYFRVQIPSIALTYKDVGNAKSGLELPRCPTIGDKHSDYHG